MARSDLELAAEWVAKAKDQLPPEPGELTALADTWTRLRTSERATKAGLDARQHQWLAEERERVRRETAEPDETNL